MRRFSSGVAHEVKNPLTSLVLLLKRLQLEYESDPDVQNRINEFIESGLEKDYTVNKEDLQVK